MFFQGWGDSIRSELYQDNITVTSVCPGPVVSNFAMQALTEKEGEVRRVF